MVSNLDPGAEMFVADVGRIQTRLAAAGRQVSSGRKIARAADAPDQIAPLLQLRANRERNEQIRSNLAAALTDAQEADAALGSAIRLMDRARVLAAEGANSFTSAAARENIAQEAQSLLEQMIARSGATVGGRFIFSGDRPDAPAYAADDASPAGVTQLLAAPATRRIEDPAGGSFAAGAAARDIFDSRDGDGNPDTDNVFAALHGLRAALLAKDTAAVTQAAGALDTASQRLSSMQASYGAIQSRIRDAQAFADRYDTDLQTQLADKQDADVAAAALELARGNTQLQAAFQMRAALPHGSLFDFLG